MKDQRYLNEEYTEMAHDIIEHEPLFDHIKSSDAQIGFLSSERVKKNAKRAVLGECEKVPEKYKWSVPFDFLITIYEPNCVGLSMEQMRILLMHELTHVGIKSTDTGEDYYIEPHDIEDFAWILRKYGIDWNIADE